MSKFVLTAQLQLQAPNNVSQVIGQIRKQLSDINVQVDVAGTAKANRDIKKLASNIKDAASSSERMGKGFAAAVRRFSASAIAYKAVGLLTSTLADATRESIAFERELIKISQVTGKTIEQLSFLSNSVSNLATNLGVASSSLLSVSRILSQAGFSADETRIALNTLAKTELAPTFDDIRQTAEGAIAIFNQFGAGAAALEEQLGSINAVAGQFAVEAGDLISVVRRTGGVFKAAGGELNELIALFTSVRATTRESAESIATGLRTIFTRIQRPKTIEYLKRYGVELEDLEGKFVGPYEAVRRLSQALAGLEEGDITFVQIAEELGGFRQIGKVIPLLQQFSVAQEALNVAQKGSGSLATDAAKAQLALAVQVSRVKEEFLELIRNVTATPTFQIMAQSALSLASALIKVADSLKPILPIITAIAAVKLTKGIGGFLGGLAGGLTSTKKFSSGGKVHAFATGGMVPGSGNRDTVPAMLTPGEFVIRKSSAQKIGASNLHSMNKGGRVKFARAGKVKAPSEYELTEDVGQLAAYEGSLAKVGNTESTTNTTLENIAKKNPNSDAAYYINSEKADPKQPVKVSGSVNNMLLGKDSKKGFASNKWLDKGLSSIDKDINTSLNKLDLPSAPSSLKDDEAVRQKIDGFALESFISGLLGKAAEGGTESFDFKGDFSNTLGDQLTRQGMPPKYLDAKRTLIGSAGIVKKGIDDKEVNVIEKFSTGGLVQKFKDGGIAQRKIGYIDYDVIANPANESVVAKGMEQTGVKGIRLYADYLTNLATRARKDSSIGKLSAIYGVAGSGKTTLARGQGTDKGKLRETERFPILTPEDIQKSTEVIVLSSSVSRKKLDEVFQPADRTYTLSSTTESDKSRVASQRASRDTTGVGLEGRKPGTTTNVESDTAVGEALLSDMLGDKSVVLGRTESGRLRRKSKDELVQIIKKKIGFTWGGFSPMTAGHESIMDAAAAAGIPAQDFIYLVGSNEGIKNSDPSSYRTAIFDQDARTLLAKAGAGSKGATILPKDKGFEVPQAFDVGTQGGRRQVVVPAKGSTTFAADKDEKSLAKYREAGYEVSNIERTGGISGTQVRDLIMSGNMGQLQQVLSPNVYELISNNIKQIRNRANVLPEIISEVKRRETTSLAEVESQIKSLGISRVDNKKVESDPEYAAQVDVLKELRKKRDKIKSFASFEPYSILAKMAAEEPEQYGLDFSIPSSSAQPMRRMSKKTQKANLGGQIKKFAIGGIVPGTGNRDTVPATLQAGDFVIRKRSVKSIGAGNLQQMSGYATGGNVDKSVPALLTPGEYVFPKEQAQKIGYSNLNKMNKQGKYALGGEVQKFQNGGVAKLKEGIVSGLFLQKGKGGTESASIPLAREKGYQLPAGFEDVSRVSANINKGLLKTEASAIAKQEIIDNVTSAIQNSTKAISNSFDIPKLNTDEQKVADDSLNKIDMNSIQGHIFESIISNISGLRLTESGASFDYVNPSEEALIRINKAFDGDVAGRFIEAKQTLSGGTIRSDENSIMNKIVANIKSGQLKAGDFNITKAQPDNKKAQLTGPLRDRLTRLYKDENRRLPTEEELISYKEVKGLAAGGMVPGVGNGDTVPATLKAGDFVIRKRSVKSIGAGNLQKMAGYASGGNVGDDVPALLTPGEFVFSKPQAKKIGYGKLNRMNKVGKYASGGVVGGRQRLFVGGVADKHVSRTEGYVDYTSVEQAGDDFAKILSQLGPKLAAEIESKFHGIQSVDAGKKTFSGNIMSDTTRGEATVFGGKDKDRSGISLQIGGKKASANTNTLAHETGHIADATLGASLGGGGKKRLASQEEGTFQFELVEKVRPQMEAAMQKAGKSAERISGYLATNEELFAEFFAKASPEVRAIITSTTDSSKGMAALKKHLEEAGHTYAGLEASDIDPFLDIIPPMDYDIKRPSDAKTDIAATAAAATPVPPPVPPAITTPSSSGGATTSSSTSSSPKDNPSAPAALGGGGGPPDDLWKSLTGNIAKLSTEINAQTSSLAGLKVEESRLQSEMKKESQVLADLKAIQNRDKATSKEIYAAHKRQRALIEEQQAVASKLSKVEKELIKAQNKKKDLISQAQSAKAEAQATKAAGSVGGKPSTYVETFGTTPPIKPPSGGGGKGDCDDKSGGDKGRGGDKGDCGDKGRGGKGRGGKGRGGKGGGGGKSGDEKGADGDSGGGGIMGMDKLTSQLLGAQVALSMLTPTIDENSSSFERASAGILNSFGSLLGAINLVTTSMSMLPQGVQDSIKGMAKEFNASDVFDLLRGKGGNIAKAAGNRVQAGVFKLGKNLQGYGGRAVGQGLKMGGTRGRLLQRAGLRAGNIGKALTGKSIPGAGKFSQFLTKLGPRLGTVVQGFTRLIGPVTAAASIVTGLNAVISAFYDNTAKLNKAIESGDIEGAEKEAGKKASLESGNTARMIGGTAGAAIGTFFGGPFGAIIGGALGTLGVTVADAIAPGFSDGLNQLFGGKSAASVVALAGAQAAAVKATKELADAQKVSSRVTEDFKNGTMSAGQALNKVRAATSAVDTQEEKAIKAVEENSKNRGGTARDIGAYLTLGYMDTSEQRNKQIDDENKAAIKSSMDADAKRFEMTKPLQLAKARATFVAGGDMDAAAEAVGIEDSVDPTTGQVKKGLRSKQFDTVQKAEELKERGDEEGAKILRESAKQTEEQILALEASLRTLQKEVEKQQKYFAAMNLGLMGAQGAAGAFSNAMSNYAAAQEAGNVSVMRSFETLQAGITSAAAGMSPDVFQNALKQTSDALRSFGADDAQIQKFEENLSAVNQAQANAQAGLKVFSQKLKDRSATGLGGLEGGDEAKFQGLFDTIVNSLPPGMGDEVKARLEDMLKGMDVDYEKIARGDFSQIEEVFKQLGVDTLEQAKKIVEAEQQYQMAIVDAAKKRAAAENDMVAGIRKGFDLEKEAREIIASAGGPALTTQQQSKMAVDRYNAGVGQGQVALGGTSAADIRQQQKDLQRRQAEIGAIRTQAAGPNDDPVAIAARKQLQGEGGVKLSNEEANLTKQNQELYNTTKTLIDIKRKEIDIIKAKNKLQQDSFDALMSGDTEGFFDSQATQGAIDAISGGGNLADFDADTLQKAFNEIKRQAAAGVTEIGGQQIQGPGGLLERAAGATLQARGLDPAQAAMMAQQGTQMSPAEQAANNEIQQLAGTLTGFAEMDKQAADMQMRAAELQVQAAEKAKADANAEVQANKGKNLPNAPAPAGQAPVGQAPAGQPPAGQAPAGQPPAGQPPAGQPPAGQAPPSSAQSSWLPDYSEEPMGVTAARIAVGGAGVGLGAYGTNGIRGLMSGGVSGGVEMADMAAPVAGKGGRLAAATGYVGDKLNQAKTFGSNAVSSIKSSRAGSYVADKLGALKQTKAGQGVSNLLSEFKFGKRGIGLADDATKLQKASNFAGGVIGKVTGSKPAEVGGKLASKSTKLLGEGAEFAAKNLGRLAPVANTAVKGFSKVAPGLGTIIDGAMEAGSFLSDPNAYNADKITKTTRDFGGMLESWGLGSLQTGVTAIDGQMASLLGGLEGALNPVGKIVEGGYNLAGGIQDAASLAQSNIAVAAQEGKASASMSETTQKRAEAAGYTGGTENYDKLSALEKSSAQRVASSMSREKQALAAQEGGGGIKQFLQATGMSQQDFDTNYGAGASLSDVARSEKSFQAVEKQGREEQRRSESWNPFASGADSDTFKKALTEKTAINEAEARDRLQKEAAASTGGDLSGQNQELQASATTALSDISALITSMNDQSANRNNISEIVQAIKQGIQAAAAGPSALRSGVMSVNNISTDSKSEDKGMGFDTSAMTQFSTALEKFNDTILKSIETLQNTKFTIQLEPTNININLTGTSFLQSLTNGLKQELLSIISSKFGNLKVDPSGRVVESFSEV